MAGLLRAVNVGGRKLLMQDLVRCASAAGLDAPSTLLASGNVVFGTSLPADAAASRLEAALRDGQGLQADVLVRDHGDLGAAMAGNPFLEAAQTAPSRLMVVFLKDAPQADLEVLTSVCGPDEAVRSGPGCLYIWYPAGAGVSKLSLGLIERRLKVRGTARNWNTVGKLLALTDPAASAHRQPDPDAAL